MKKVISLVAVFMAGNTYAQSDVKIADPEIEKFQTELNEEYRNKETTPLEPKDFRKFKGHSFYPADLTYRVVAKLIPATNPQWFSMKTTTPRTASYRVYANAEFELNGKVFSIPVYQSADLMKMSEYADHLFFPFTDNTNGKETYSGGRFIDLHLPKSGNQVTIDFNLAYNPLCAYSNRYSCPVVPQANHIDTEIKAGVKFVGKH